MKSIGSYIETLRKNKRMSITKLADIADISRPYLSQIESGTRKPSIDILRKLSEALDVNIIRFLLDIGHITASDIEIFIKEMHKEVD